MNKYILGFAIVVSLYGCDNRKKEHEALQRTVDSLRTELIAGKEAEEKMNEVGILIDSIDASRKSFQLKMSEGSSYSDYADRLRNINTYVQNTKAKLDALEKSTNASSKATARSIRQLKADLEKRTKEILDLQLQLAMLRDENTVLWLKLEEKDTLLSLKDKIIKLNKSDIASLEKLFMDTQDENKAAVGNLYYKQASTLELVANRTQFAPRKKKAARREALELYKLSLSLGNEDAQKRIEDLEKKLN